MHLRSSEGAETGLDLDALAGAAGHPILDLEQAALPQRANQRLGTTTPPDQPRPLTRHCVGGMTGTANRDLLGLRAGAAILQGRGLWVSTMSPEFATATKRYPHGFRLLSGYRAD